LELGRHFGSIYDFEEVVELFVRDCSSVPRARRQFRGSLNAASGFRDVASLRLAVSEAKQAPALLQLALAMFTNDSQLGAALLCLGKQLFAGVAEVVSSGVWNSLNHL